MNSYSARLSVKPNLNWLFQVSAGRLTRPERQEPGDVMRTTASAHYSVPLASGSVWSTSLIWGRNHSTYTHRNLNSYLLESVYPIGRRNFVTGRIELVDKDELFADNTALEEQLNRTAGSTFRIQAYTAGYTRDVPLVRNIETGVGANVTAYETPAAIRPYYGEHPWGVNVFVRFRLKPEK